MLFDLLADHAGRALAIYHWPESVDGEGILRDTISHPLLSARPTVSIWARGRTVAASAPSRASWASTSRAGTVTPEAAVRSGPPDCPPSGCPLRHRGLLQVGHERRRHGVRPGHAGRPQYVENGRVAPSGISHVLVAGEPVVRDGRPTGRLPGRIVGRS
jgi:hypothetical protein